MSYEAPRLVGSASSSAAEVSLKGNTRFEFSIPDPNDIPASAEVSLIVGSDPESPDLKGHKVLAGRFDEDQDDVVKLSNLTLALTSDDLKDYANRAISIRYLVRSESGDSYSAPLEIKVLP
ncbi:hypothetical protein [Pseudomonas sp. MPB23]|uniref:hypothetical protein n=1 Tax=Pseudomonas sp. MPB23 TaxID=3388490 RepID=UPI003984E19A